MSCGLEWSYAKRVCVCHHLHCCDSRYAGQAAELRIIRPGVTLSEYDCARLARCHCRSAQPLQLGDATGMIKVDMRIENELHILDPQAQLPDAGRNLCCRFRQIAVNEDVAAVGRDENRAEPANPYVVGVSVDSKRLLGCVPRRTLLARGGLICVRDHGRGRQRCKQYCCQGAEDDPEQWRES